MENISNITCQKLLHSFPTCHYIVKNIILYGIFKFIYFCKQMKDLIKQLTLF